MAGVHRSRHPERTVLYRVLFHHFEWFLAEYETCFERETMDFLEFIARVTSHIPDKAKWR